MEFYEGCVDHDDDEDIVATIRLKNEVSDLKNDIEANIFLFWTITFLLINGIIWLVCPFILHGHTDSVTDIIMHMLMSMMLFPIVLFVLTPISMEFFPKHKIENMVRKHHEKRQKEQLKH